MHPPTITRRRTPDLDRSTRADPERFAVLYARHRDELARYCRSILRHDQDVEDALQSTMTKAFAALRDETRQIAVRPWLYRIARNESISILRRRLDVAEFDDGCGSDPDLVPRAAETRERLRQLQADLRDLPERQRSALVLRELSGLGHREIGAALGTSPAAAKQAIYEARCGLDDCAEGRSLSCERVRRALSDNDRRSAGRRRLRAHLRSCRSCSAFDAALRQRPRDLGAILPTLPALAASGAAAGVPVALAGAGGGAVGATTTASLAGTGWWLGGGLAIGTVSKLAAIVAVGTIAVGGVVTVEHGPPTPPGSDHDGTPVADRSAPSASSDMRVAATDHHLMLPQARPQIDDDRPTATPEGAPPRPAARDSGPTPARAEPPDHALGRRMASEHRPPDSRAPSTPDSHPARTLDRDRGRRGDTDPSRRRPRPAVPQASRANRSPTGPPDANVPASPSSAEPPLPASAPGLDRGPDRSAGTPNGNGAPQREPGTPALADLDPPTNTSSGGRRSLTPSDD